MIRGVREPKSRDQLSIQRSFDYLASALFIDLEQARFPLPLGSALGDAGDLRIGLADDHAAASRKRRVPSCRSASIP
jgi:hypothetical protein